MRRNALLILVALTMAVVTAATLTQRDTSVIARSGEAVFPELLNDINRTAKVVGMSGGKEFTLERHENRWVVPEKAGYPASQDEVRKLLIGAAELKRVEPKTSNPDLYAKLGLDDVTAEGSSAVRYRLLDASGDVLADFLLGNSRSARGDPDASEYYVREPHDAQSWLVEGRLPDITNAVEWLDDGILTLERERVRRVTVRHPDGHQVEVFKSEPDEQDFQLAGKPEDAEIDGDWKLNDMGRAMAELELNDVRPGADQSVSADGYVATLVTFDGLRVRLESTKDGESTLARLYAEFDPDLVSREHLSGEGGTGEQKSKLLGAEEVQKEAEGLNERWRDWVFVLPGYRSGYLSKRRDEIIKSPDKGAAEGQQSGG
jgi:hypothetical protein